MTPWFPRRPWLPLAVSMAMALAGRPALAAGPLRVILRIAEPADQELLVRLHGQTSDLPVELISAGAGPLEPTLSGQIAGAQALAAGRADVIMWLARAECAAGERRDLLLHVSQPASGNVLIRRLAGPACEHSPTPEATSSLLETAALAIRTTLVALGEGGTIGVARAARPPAQASPAPAAPGRAAARIAAHAVWIADGVTPTGEAGLGMSVGLGGRRLGLGLSAAATSPATVTDQYTALALSRAMIITSVVSHWPLTADLAVAAALGGGVALLRYRATGRAAGVVAAPPGRVTSAALSAEVRLELAPDRWAGVGLTLGAGLDYLPAAGALSYARDGELEGTRSLWRVGPRLLIGIQFVRQ